MKREEAISLLGWFKSKTNREDDLEAIDMAIKALQGGGGDLISRADAIEAVCGVVIDEFNVSPTGGYEVAEKALSALPSAERGDAETNPIPTGTGVMIPSPNNGADDLISRELAMERIANDNVSGGMDRINEYNNSTEFNDYLDGISDAITTIFCDVPSAEAVSREAIMSAKFHPLPYTHITPTDADAESYKRGWNDALDAVADNAPSAEAVQGEWKHKPSKSGEWIWWQCSVCGAVIYSESEADRKIHHAYCGVCGARMYKGGDSE